VGRGGDAGLRRVQQSLLEQHDRTLMIQIIGIGVQRVMECLEVSQAQRGEKQAQQQDGQNRSAIQGFTSLIERAVDHQTCKEAGSVLWRNRIVCTSSATRLARSRHCRLPTGGVLIRLAEA